MSVPTFRVRSAQSQLARGNAINIELWGFRENRIVKVMAVARALELLPPHQLEGLKKISYEERASIPGLRGWIRLPGKSAHRGRYESATNSITIHRCETREQFFHTLFHEVGHFVYFRVLSSFEKKRWVKDTYRSEPAVTPYGQRNAAEDFAEAFVLYAIYPQRLTEKPRKFHFLQNVVFRGVPVDNLAVVGLVNGRQDEDDNLGLNITV